jgi:hypothetical protein
VAGAIGVTLLLVGTPASADEHEHSGHSATE